MEAYRAPKSTLEQQPIKKRETLGKIFAWLSLGAILMLPGVYFTWDYLGLLFVDIESDSIASSRAMATRISQSMVPATASTIVSLPSLICLFLSLATSSYRSRRFYRFWIFLAIVWILAVPIGTVFGLILAIVLYLNRKSFRISQKWPYI